MDSEKYLPQPAFQHRFRRAPAAPVQPVFKVLHPDDVGHLGVPDLDGDSRQPASDITDPVVNAQGGEGLGDGFVKGLRRHVERVLCFVQVVDDDGTSLEPDEGNLSYSPFVRP